MKKINKKTIIRIAIIFVILLLLVVILLLGRSFAYFNAVINELDPGSEKVKLSSSNITIDYDGGGEINVGGVNPGWTETRTFTVKNNNTETETYNIVWKEVINTYFNNGDIVYSITGPVNKGETIAPLGDGGIFVNIEIAAGVLHEYTLTIEYKDRGQEKELDSIFYGLIKVTQDGEEVREGAIANQELILDLIYPVGTIHLSTNSANPSEYFGIGEWEAYGTGRTLVGVDEANTNFDEVEKIGGEEAHVLTPYELPTHRHGIPSLSGTAASAGGHTHGFPYGGNALVLGATTGDSGTYGPGFSFATGTGWWVNTHKTRPGLNTAGAHTHSVTTTASTTEYAGNDRAHNNLQPYITTYMWKRVS